VRTFASSALRAKEVAGPESDTPNMRFAPRDEAVKLKRAIVNPADQYKEKGESLHKYGQYIMSCLPKYVQQ
jgi:NADH dehydrogenase (ubiquinone) Fe-S protein 3